MYSVAVVLEALRCGQGGKEQIAARSKVERGKEQHQRSRKVLDFQSALSVCVLVAARACEHVPYGYEAGKERHPWLSRKWRKGTLLPDASKRGERGARLPQVKLVKKGLPSWLPTLATSRLDE